MANVQNKKLKELLNKTIALILVCVMVLNLFPNIVLGIKNMSDDEIVEETIAEISTTEEANIIGEDIEKRTLNEKHFILDNGTMLLAMYPENVHYEKDGKLEDIDNTLIENDGVYENKANSFKVTFEKTAKTDQLARLDTNGFEIKWALEGTVNEQLIEKEILTQKTKIKKEINLIEAKINKKENNIESNNSKKEKTVLNSLNSKIEYNNIIENIDLRYDIISNGIKESIVLNNKESMQESFIFVFDIGTLTAELTEDNEVIIYNGKKDNIIYVIEAPYMFDNNQEYSSDIEVKIENTNKDEKNNQYRITIKPNKDWLEDEKRVYPITIDPTVVTSQMRSKIQDTYIYSGDTGNTTKGNAHVTRIGNSKFLGSGNPGRGLIKFDLPELSSGDQVIYAGLSIYNYAKTSEWTPPTRQMQLDVHKMTTNWEENNAYWDNLSASSNYDSRIVDYTLYQFDSNNPNTCYQQWFDITSIAKEWYTTGNNYGVMIKEHNEIMGYADESDMYFVSSDTSSAYYDARPMVTIEYRNQTGIEDYLSYHIQDARRAGVVYTNDYNGNVVWLHDDVSTPGTRLPASIYHVYNANDKGTDIGYGRGIRLNLSQIIELVDIGGTEYARYIDEDGTRHYFIKQENSNIYKDEDGLGLTLTLSSSRNDFILEDKAGNRSNFNRNIAHEKEGWYLNQITDTNGNNIIITLAFSNVGEIIITKVTDAAGKEINLSYYNSGKLSEIEGADGKSYQYAYNDLSNLTDIIYPDNERTKYTYSNDLLTNVENVDGTKLVYEYYPESTTRVRKITEYGMLDTLGKSLDITYGANLTIFKDNEGYTNNINFNDYGQAISIADLGKEGNNLRNAYGKSYEYGTDGGNKNKLTLEGKLICSNLLEGNLLQNGDFSQGDLGRDFWSGWNINENDKSYTIDNNTALGLVGEGTVDKHVFQDVATSGEKGDLLKFSAWVKANGIDIPESTKCIRLITAIYKSDGETQWKHTTINSDSNGWQYVTQETIAEEAYTSVRVYLSYSYNANITYFTNVSLIKDEGGNSYTYDSNGNLISSQNLAKENSTFEYDGEDQLIKSTNPKGGSFTYEYDATRKNRLLNAVSATGLKYSFEYDNYGNATSSKISVNNGTTGKYIETTAEYSADGNYLTTITDEKGNETNYTYNETTGTTSKVTDAKGQETNYTYDNLDRVSTVSKTVGTKTYQNTYTYLKDKINTITHNGFNYNFLYDNFGNVSQVKVGEQALITNNYESNNGNLLSAVYGNNQRISYLYDRFNRITTKTGTDGSHEYTYDSKSNLKTYKDNVNNETITYLYDFADRIIQKQNTNGFNIQYGYDKNNNINNTIYTLSNNTNQLLYTFDKDNKITNINLNANTNIVTNYDELSRVENKELNVGTNTYKTEYTYEDTDIANKTTTSLKRIKNGTNNEITYTYDELGNIETITEGNTLKAKYYYDELSQLIREDNVYLNKTITYTYDLGGNITVKSEYPYTTGELGTATKTITYTYDNTNWKDQLTNYNGDIITYDGIGNPTSYKDNTYAWQNGRQLQSIINDPTVRNLGENFNSSKIIETLSGDFNGDDKYDIAVLYNYGNSQVKVIVWIRTVSGFSEGQVWYNSGINGLNISAIQDRIVAGDFNGDGKTDIGVVYDCGNSETKVYTFISSGNSFEKQLWISSPVGSIDALRVTGRVVAGDFSGDGKDDIAGLYDYGGATAGVIVWKSTGTQFNDRIWKISEAGSTDANQLTGRVVAGDFDGDEICDIAGIYNYPNASTGVIVWKSTGTSFSDSSLWDRTAEGSAYATSFTKRVVTVDYNGDGKDDIAGIYDYSNGTSRLLVWTSQGASFETFKLGYKIGTSFTISQLTGKIVGGDYNKDGKDDIGLITSINNKGTIYVFNSTGTAYAAPEELWNTDNIISYKYNDNGIRTSKTVGGVETKYYLDGSKVIYEKTGEDVIYYSYDENGQVIGMNRNGTQYYYIKNAQNDVIGLLDNTLQQIVSYKNIQAGEK